MKHGQCMLDDMDNGILPSNSFYSNRFQSRKQIEQTSGEGKATVGRG